MADEETVTAEEQTTETTTTETEVTEAPAQKTILSGGGDDDEAPAPGPSDTPGQSETNWRDGMAGEDDKFRKQLDRFSDTAAMGKAYQSMVKKMSSGEYTKTLAEDASEDEVKTWRKENNLPEAAEGFVENIALPEGVVLGEADQPIAASFGKLAMDGNFTQDQYNKAVAWHYTQLDATAIEQAENDSKNKVESEDALRSGWEAGDYRRNINAIDNMVSKWPEGLADSVLLARTPEGRVIGDDPAFIRQLAQMAIDLDPAATLVPPGTGDVGKGVDDQINEMKGWMSATKGSDDWKKYYKDEGAQNRYKELLEAKERINSRAA